jgi:hypothetical protein
MSVKPCQLVFSRLISVVNDSTSVPPNLAVIVTGVTGEAIEANAAEVTGRSKRMVLLVLPFPAQCAKRKARSIARPPAPDLIIAAVPGGRAILDLRIPGDRADGRCSARCED